VLRDFILATLNRVFRWRGMELRALTPPHLDSGM